MEVEKRQLVMNFSGHNWTRPALARVAALPADVPSFAGGERGQSAAANEAADAQRFEVDVQWRAGVATVRPRGDVDLVSVEMLQAALDGIASAARVVLDLSGVSFIDSAGLHLLVGLHRRARRERFQLSLVPPTPPADLAIELCGLYDVLPFTRPPESGQRDSRNGRESTG